MKKLLALILALSMVLSVSAVLVSAAGDAEAPSTYLWIKGTNGEGINFLLPGDQVDEGTITVKALVYFGEDCDGSGSVYLNCYPWADSSTLLNWRDYASNKVCEAGKWLEVELVDLDPSKDGKRPAFLTFGVGFYNASGTIKVGHIQVFQNDDCIWSVSFESGLDLNADFVKSYVGLSVGNKGTVWGIEGVKDTEPDAPIAAPDNYLTLMCDGEGPVPGITYQIPASLVGDNNLTVEALVYFGEDCAGTGNVYLNLYPYEGETLLRWKDYATAKDNGMGEWKKAELKNWNPKLDDSNVPDKYNIGVGFYEATGTVKVAYIKVIVNDKVVWSVTFDKLDLNDEYLINHANIDESTREVTWDITGEFIPENISEPDGVLGDYDGDENVTSDDAVYLLRYTLFPNQYPVTGYADFDGDGNVTSDDAVYLLRYTLFPAQYPLTVK